DPDVVTLDIELPDINGIDLLKKIKKESSAQVIIVTSHGEDKSSMTFEAMQAGAVDFILKPTQETMQGFTEQITRKAKAAASAQLQSFKPKKPVSRHRFSPSRKKIIVIASSTGGPQTLEALLVQLPKNIPAGILIVQHMPEGFTGPFAQRLDKACSITVREAKEGDDIEDGTALIAPGGSHMELKSINPLDQGTIHLTRDPPELGVRPCANKLFRSVANVFEENTIGVVLTGMGSDGTEGSREIKRHQGTVIAQSEETCIIFGMPKEVIKAELADEVLPLNKIPQALVQLLDI
ncbi:MAG: chemotaxis-specific protein-glutamate methyltransferase CheB, partial [Nanoarchaeota archaeon]